MLKICKVMPVKETSFFSMNWQQVVGLFYSQKLIASFCLKRNNMKVLPA